MTWRLAERFGDTLEVDRTFTSDDYRQAKREAIHRNTRQRRTTARCWVVVRPDGTAANIGPDQ